MFETIVASFGNIGFILIVLYFIYLKIDSPQFQEKAKSNQDSIAFVIVSNYETIKSNIHDFFFSKKGTAIIENSSGYLRSLQKELLILITKIKDHIKDKNKQTEHINKKLDINEIVSHSPAISAAIDISERIDNYSFKFAIVPYSFKILLIILPVAGTLITINIDSSSENTFILSSGIIFLSVTVSYIISIIINNIYYNLDQYLLYRESKKHITRVSYITITDKYISVLNSNGKFLAKNNNLKFISKTEGNTYGIYLARDRLEYPKIWIFSYYRKYKDKIMSNEEVYGIEGELNKILTQIPRSI